MPTTSGDLEYQRKWRKEHPGYQKKWLSAIKTPTGVRMTDKQKQRIIDMKRKQEEIEGHRKTVFTGGYDDLETIRLGINYEYSEGDVI